MLYRFRIAFFLLGLCSGSCHTKQSASIDSICLDATQNFFNRLGTPNYAIALDSMLQSNKNIDLDDSTTVKLREGFKNINELSGRYLGYNLLKKRVVKDDIALYSYLVKYEKKFYRYIFTFYKTGTKVHIFKFAYDDVLDLELEESLKLYTQ